jgi:hypothetical protein
MTYNHIPLETIDHLLIGFRRRLHLLTERVFKQFCPNIHVSSNKVLDQIPFYVRRLEH